MLQKTLKEIGKIQFMKLIISLIIALLVAFLPIWGAYTGINYIASFATTSDITLLIKIILWVVAGGGAFGLAIWLGAATFLGVFNFLNRK